MEAQPKKITREPCPTTPSSLTQLTLAWVVCRPPLAVYRLYIPLTNQEPTAHQRAAYRDKRKEVGDPETELACWLLEALAKESEGAYVRGLMHQRFTMETLARYLYTRICFLEVFPLSGRNGLSRCVWFSSVLRC